MHLGKHCCCCCCGGGGGVDAVAVAIVGVDGRCFNRYVVISIVVVSLLFDCGCCIWCCFCCFVIVVVNACLHHCHVYAIVVAADVLIDNDVVGLLILHSIGNLLLFSVSLKRLLMVFLFVVVAIVASGIFGC